MERRLCATCRTEGQKKCLFIEGVNGIAGSVPPLEQQMPIAPNSETTIEAADASERIAQLREEMRPRGCPDINFDPPYPGRENLGKVAVFIQEAK